MKKLTIEEWKPKIELESIEYKWMKAYWDISTHIAIHRIKINKILEVGKKYDFTFEDDNDEDTYTYLVLRKESDSEYLIVEAYGVLISLHEWQLGGNWKKCDILKTLNLDLKEIYDNYINGSIKTYLSNMI